MFKYEPTTVHGFVILAPTEIGVVFLEFAATSALFFLPVIRFIVGVDGPLASVAPNDSQERSIELNVDGHSTSVR